MSDAFLVAESIAVMRARLERKELHQADLLHDGALELVVEEVDGIQLVRLVRLDEVGGDLARLRVPEAPEEPDVVLAGLDAALAGEVAPAASDRGELDPFEPGAL